MTSGFRTARKSFRKALHGSQASSLSSKQPGFVDLNCSLLLLFARASAFTILSWRTRTIGFISSCKGSSLSLSLSLSLSFRSPEITQEMGSMSSQCLESSFCHCVLGSAYWEHPTPTALKDLHSPPARVKLGPLSRVRLSVTNTCQVQIMQSYAVQSTLRFLYFCMYVCMHAWMDVCYVMLCYDMEWNGMKWNGI